MLRLDQEPVVGNCLRLLLQRTAIYPAQGVAQTPRSISRPYLPRVNVYLCIKQALFIQPMNMHCLVAVARCRVQTRRYHCLINHTQSHRPTLCTPSSCFTPRSTLPRAPLSSPLLQTRRGLAVSSLRALHEFPLAVFPSIPIPSPSPPACPQSTRCAPPTGRN